jgi:predicted nucleic acid-binding protein
MTLRHIADRFTVILDANVLYPVRLRDVLLRFYEGGLFRARWTDRIIDEWKRNLIRNRPDKEASVLAQLEQMRAHFEEAWVAGYEPLIPALELPDPDDRHVLAAAIVCGAQHIVTENLKDFPSDVLEEFDIEAIDPDEFLIRTFELYPANVVSIFRQMRSDYKNPSYSQAEFLLNLTASGLPKIASILKSFKAEI